MNTEKVKKEKISISELEENLSHFTGSENFYKAGRGTSLIYTDGVKAMADLAGAYWLIDVVASYISKLRRNFDCWEFSLVCLEVKEAETGLREALFTIRSDTDKKAYISQKIPYTDFPVGVFEMFFEGGVLLLKSEH